MNLRTLISNLALSCLLIAMTFACRSPVEGEPESGTGDPALATVRLPAGDGWEGSLVFDNGETGIWTAGVLNLFPQYATPEVVGLDDRGRCLILVSYSGKWTPMVLGHDGKWLGGLAHGDVDPRVAGSELYTGGQKGNLYQLTFHPQGAADMRLIAHLPGREIHTIVAGDVDRSFSGRELLLFTRPGGLYRVSPTGRDGTFETVHVQDLPGRVRDAVILPGPDDEAPEIATVSRSGRLELLEMTARGPEWSVLYESAMGMGRLTLRPPREGEATVLYASHDDGRVLRFERSPSGTWTEEVIYRGPQGVRGIAAGRFCADGDVETVAVFGYSAEVVLLSRKGREPWNDAVIFVDRDKGHWLTAAELDGRNTTQEIIGSGYGGRIFLLSRPSGYGTAPSVDSK